MQKDVGYLVSTDNLDSCPLRTYLAVSKVDEVFIIIEDSKLVRTKLGIFVDVGSRHHGGIGVMNELIELANHQDHVDSISAKKSSGLNEKQAMNPMMSP